jgi:hypothetical protein
MNEQSPEPEPDNGEELESKQNALKAGRSGVRNNYDDIFYISDMPDFTVKPHIDKIRVSSIHPSFLNKLSTLLQENGFRKKSDLKLKKGKYQKKRTFTNGTIEVGIFYNPANSSIGWSPPIFIEIQDPTQEILDWFDWQFSNLRIFPKVSQVEMAFDFYTGDPGYLQIILDRHLFLRYQRRPSFRWKTTFYAGDCRKSSKGSRTYVKKINEKNIARLELVLNRRVIKQLKIELPLRNINKIDYGKFFTFKVLIIDRIIRSLIRESKEAIMSLDKEDGMSGQLLAQQIVSWVRSLLIEYPYKKKILENIKEKDLILPGEEKLMEQVEFLKSKDRGIRNYSRFLRELPGLNERFRKALAGKQFLPPGKKK